MKEKPATFCNSTIPVVILTKNNIPENSVSKAIDNSMQEPDDFVMLRNSVEPTVPTNTEKNPVYVFNNPPPTCIIKQILPDMNRIWLVPVLGGPPFYVEVTKFIRKNVTYV